jgi:hypothetical protein
LGASGWLVTASALERGSGGHLAPASSNAATRPPDGTVAYEMAEWRSRQPEGDELAGLRRACPQDSCFPLAPHQEMSPHGPPRFPEPDLAVSPGQSPQRPWPRARPEAAGTLVLRLASSRGPSLTRFSVQPAQDAGISSAAWRCAPAPSCAPSALGPCGAAPPVPLGKVLERVCSACLPGLGLRGGASLQTRRWPDAALLLRVPPSSSALHWLHAAVRSPRTHALSPTPASRLLALLPSHSLNVGMERSVRGWTLSSGSRFLEAAQPVCLSVTV